MFLSLAAPCGFAADGSAALEEIIVTARKVPEAISRVPMSVQALSGNSLDRRDLSSLYDLQMEVPGLVVNNRGMFGAGIALRGVTDEGGGSVAIAPHINGVYLGRSNLALTRLFDVGRVEVLKGPQGTLYGRNATGGSINVVTRAPEPQYSAAVEAAFGTFDAARVKGYVNLAAEKLAARIAVVGSDSDGYIRNSIDDRRFAAENYAGARISLRAQPSAALTIDVTAQRVDDDGASSELWLPRRDFLPNPADIRLTTVTLADPNLTTANDLGIAELAYKLGDLTLRSITGYARNVTNSLDDCAGTRQLRGCVRGVQPLRYQQHSQELRFESSPGGSFAWLVGAFYFKGQETQNFHFRVGSPVPINDYTATADETAHAAFGDATLALDQRWSLGGGLRFSREKQRVTRIGSGTADLPALATASGSWNDASWRLGLEFTPTDRLLVFANISTGFKSGGVTTERLPNGEFDGYGPEKLLAYEAGVSAALPDGHSTLRASAFYYDFDDMQVRTTTVLANNQVATVTDNAAAVRVGGVDLSATTKISDGLTFTGALVWMPRREFVEFIDAASGSSLTGNKISRAPEWSLSASIGYRAPVAGVGELSAEFDYNYRSRFFFAKENSLLLSQEAFGLLNLNLRLESAARRWYLFASARNLLDRDYFNQILLQSSPGHPATYEIGLGLRF
jgi:iron complex outermembrane receptor protein